MTVSEDGNCFKAIYFVIRAEEKKFIRRVL